MTVEHCHDDFAALQRDYEHNTRRLPYAKTQQERLRLGELMKHQEMELRGWQQISIEQVFKVAREMTIFDELGLKHLRCRDSFDGDLLQIGDIVLSLAEAENRRAANRR